MTNIMDQYFDIKERYRDCLLFFRLGDFYELFFDDAVIASNALGLTLTGRDVGGARAKMCGVPRHALEPYISRLVGEGHKVAVCEQLGEPGAAIIRREVTRVVTPGTLTDEAALDARRNNYIMCIYEGEGIGCACADVTTGEFLAAGFSAGEYKAAFDEIAKFGPRELIVNPEFSHAADIKKQFGLNAETLAEAFFAIKDKRSEKNGDAARAVAGLYHYLENTQKNCLNFLKKPRYYTKDKYLGIDAGSRRNLELTANLRGRAKSATLLSVLDKTRTPMGARCLRRWLDQPLTDAAQINKRLDAVEFFLNDEPARLKSRELLSGVKDLERLTMRVALGSAGAAQLYVIAASLEPLPAIKAALPASRALLKEMAAAFDDLSDMRSALAAALSESEDSGGAKRLIKAGFSEEYDRAFESAAQLDERVKALEAAERARTGNKNLKIANNKAFGYYIELSRDARNIPADYMRRQTLSNCERYVTQDLLDIESGLALARQRLADCEERVTLSLLDGIRRQAGRIQLTSYVVATLDALLSLAQAARENGYVKPVISPAGGVIDIRGGRHPVVELMTDEKYVPNDARLGGEDLLAIITGPNMAGKSTYMRQTALIVIMAQMGGFVPADSARISICDKIFTRAGASDDLASGQSTFMVEMNEVANIVENATADSLIILDEVGRGTSTYDGLCIAWGVLEHIVGVIKAKTLFATHYHELTELEGKLPGVRNYSMSLTETNGALVYDRRLAAKPADGSFGLHAAQMAGMPEGIISRARQLLNEISRSGARPEGPPREPGEAVDYSDGNIGIAPDIDFDDRFFISEIVRLRRKGVTLRDAVRQIIGEEKQ